MEKCTSSTAGPNEINAAQSQYISSIPLPADTGTSSIALPRNVLFAYTGHRYGVRNYRSAFPLGRSSNGKNTMRNGRYLQCRQCSSEDRFIRDCPEPNKNRLACFAMAKAGDSVYEMSVNETLDLIQDLPDQEWKALLASAKDDSAYKCRKTPSSSIKRSR